MSEKWIDGPMLGFDLETTGPDPEAAVPVQVGFYRDRMLGSEATSMSSSFYVNPGIPIPHEATAVHGITDATVERAMSVRQALQEIILTLNNAQENRIPVVGMNLTYDLTIVDRLLALEHCRFDPTFPILDVLVIDKRVDRYRKGSRTLVAMAEHYGLPSFEAHGAAADTKASVLILREMVKRYPAIAAMSLETLTSYQVDWKHEQATSLNVYRVGNGQPPLDNGEYYWPVKPRRDDAVLSVPATDEVKAFQDEVARTIAERDGLRRRAELAENEGEQIQ